jgi:hypothetical protein
MNDMSRPKAAHESTATTTGTVAPAEGKPRCRRCGKGLNRKTAVFTAVGVFCKRHGDRIAPHLHRAGGVS